MYVCTQPIILQKKKDGNESIDGEVFFTVAIKLNTQMPPDFGLFYHLFRATIKNIPIL